MSAGAVRAAALETTAMVGSQALREGLRRAGRAIDRSELDDDEVTAAHTVLDALERRADDLAVGSAGLIVQAVGDLATGDRASAERMLWLAARATSAQRVAASRASSSALLEAAERREAATAQTIEVLVDVSATAARVALPFLLAEL